MGLFKKKKKKIKQLPLPPAPSEGPPVPSGFGDVTDIYPEKKERLPPLPEFPPFRVEEIETKEAFPKPFIPELEPPVPLMPELEVPFAGEKKVFKKIKSVPQKFAPKAFVAANDYKNIVNNCNVIREKLMAADHHLKNLEALKDDEEHMLNKWLSYLERVEKKMSFVDQIIAKAGEKNE